MPTRSGRLRSTLVTAAVYAATMPAAGRAQLPVDGHVALRLDTAEAVAVLGILERRASGGTVPDSDSLARRAAELRRTLTAWEGMDVRAAAARALAYLPLEASIRATVYVVIKPRTDGFVFEVRRWRTSCITSDSRAFSCFGEQGPWYTVGWKMAVTIERRYGRAVLIRCMEDPRLLLDRYNEAAADHNRTQADTLARWSPALLGAIAGR